MSTTTTNYGLIKPDTTDPILVGQLNDNMDTIDTVLKDHSDKIDAAALGIKYKGEVNYYADLPNSAKIGDAYTVKYAGSSGTTPDGTEYVWGTVSGTNQWINFSKDSYTKAEVDALLAIKQNALTTAQLAAVNSGIDSTKVAQIETNKNNISMLTADMSKVQTGLGAVCVLRSNKSSSTTYTYTMSIDDFSVPPSISIGSSGTYLVSILTWSTTPTYSIYTASYSGGNTTTYNLVQKISGADANVTCTGGVITITSSGKVQIYALR